MLLCCFFCASRKLNAQCALAFKARGPDQLCLRRMLQSIVGHVFAGGEVTARQGAVSTLNSLLQDLQLSENITRTRMRKHQTSNSFVPRNSFIYSFEKGFDGLDSIMILKPLGDRHSLAVPVAPKLRPCSSCSAS